MSKILLFPRVCSQSTSLHYPRNGFDCAPACLDEDQWKILPVSLEFCGGERRQLALHCRTTVTNEINLKGLKRTLHYVWKIRNLFEMRGLPLQERMGWLLM